MALWNVWRIWRILGCLFCLGVCACLIWLAVISQSGSWYYTPVETPVTTHCSWCWTQRCFHHWFSKVLFRLANCVSAGGCCHVLRLFQEDLEMDVLSPWLRTRRIQVKSDSCPVFWWCYYLFSVQGIHPLLLPLGDQLINTPMAVSTSTFFHQQILWGSDFCCLTSRARGGLVPVGCTENMTCMGSFIERFFPTKPEKKTTPWFLILFFQKKVFSWNMFFFFGSQWIFFRDRPPINLGPPGTPYYSAQAQRMRLFRCPFAEVAFLWWLWISRHQIGVPPRVMYKTKRDNFLQNNGSTFF